MKNWSKKKKFLIALLILFLAAQIIQPSKNTDNPAGPKDITNAIQTSDSVLSLLKKSCYDCHSNYTDYPWYDNITPVNWWVADHIIEGKQELNFTIFARYKRNQQMQLLEEIGETVQMGAMPLKSYLLVHNDAKLSQNEKQIIYNWIRKSMDELSLIR